MYNPRVFVHNHPEGFLEVYLETANRADDVLPGIKKTILENRLNMNGNVSPYWWEVWGNWTKISNRKLQGERDIAEQVRMREILSGGRGY